MYMCIIYIYIYTYIHTSLSLSVSLSLHICLCISQSGKLNSLWCCWAHFRNLHIYED